MPTLTKKKFYIWLDNRRRPGTFESYTIEAALEEAITYNGLVDRACTLTVARAPSLYRDTYRYSPPTGLMGNFVQINKQGESS